VGWGGLMLWSQSGCFGQEFFCSCQDLCPSLPAQSQVPTVTVLFHIDWNIIYKSVNKIRWEVWIGFVGVITGMTGGLR